MSAAPSNRSQASRIERIEVRPVVDAWLNDVQLEGVDVVRAALARAMADQLDDRRAPRSVRPRVVAEMRFLLADMGNATRDDARHRNVERLLAEVTSVA